MQIAAMKPKRSPHKSKQRDLFRTELTKIIDPGHGLVKLSEAVDWNRMDAAFTERYCPGNGRPAISIRLMVSLQYLKHIYSLSDHDVVYGWVENPYWQYLSGMQYFEHDPPINPSSMSRWRKRIGEAGAEALLKETAAAGLTIKAIKPRPFKRVTVDTIVQGGSKAIVRLWHGRTQVSQADAYAEFLKERAVPDYRSIDGLKKLYFLRRIDEGAAHFLLVTLWDSTASVEKFAG